MFVLQLVTHVFCLNVLLLAHELFKFIAWKFNFSSVKLNKCHWRKKLHAWRGKHSPHLRVNMTKRTRTSKCNWKRWCYKCYNSPSLIQGKKILQAVAEKVFMIDQFTRKMAITAVHVLRWVCMETYGNITEWARKPSAKIFKTPRLLEWNYETTRALNMNNSSLPLFLVLTPEQAHPCTRNIWLWRNFVQCNVTTMTKQSHDITMLSRDVGLLEHKMALHGPEIRKSFKEAQKKGKTRQN